MAWSEKIVDYSDTEEVTGSIPVSSTEFPQVRPCVWSGDFSFWRSWGRNREQIGSGLLHGPDPAGSNGSRPVWRSALTCGSFYGVRVGIPDGLRRRRRRTPRVGQGASRRQDALSVCVPETSARATWVRLGSAAEPGGASQAGTAAPGV